MKKDNRKVPLTLNECESFWKNCLSVLINFIQVQHLFLTFYYFFPPFFCFIFQRRLNVDCYSISPDLNFILLYQCSTDDINGTKYFVYEIFSSNIYPLSPTDNNVEVELQRILWSPSYDSSLNSRDRDISNNNNNNNNNKVLPNNRNKVKHIEKNRIAQAVAFIYNYDIYYKPKIHSDLVCRITTTGNRFLYKYLGSSINDVWLFLAGRG